MSIDLQKVMEESEEQGDNYLHAQNKKSEKEIKHRSKVESREEESDGKSGRNKSS